MKEAIYTNRHKDKIKFTQVDEYTVEVTDYFDMGVRMIGTEDNIQAVDPSGGPYIAIGAEVGGYTQQQIMGVVKEIKFGDNKIILTI